MSRSGQRTVLTATAYATRGAPAPDGGHDTGRGSGTSAIHGVMTRDVLARYAQTVPALTAGLVALLGAWSLVPTTGWVAGHAWTTALITTQRPLPNGSLGQ